MGRRPLGCHACALKYYRRRKRCQGTAPRPTGLRGQAAWSREQPGDHSAGIPRPPGHEPLPQSQACSSGSPGRDSMEGSQDIIMEQQVQPATWTLLLDERQHQHKHYTRMIQEVTGPGSALALRVKNLKKPMAQKSTSSAICGSSRTSSSST